MSFRIILNTNLCVQNGHERLPSSSSFPARWQYVPGLVGARVNSLSMKAVDFELLSAVLSTIDVACDEVDQAARPST